MATYSITKSGSDYIFTYTGLRIKTGSEADGKVLFSDTDGQVSWKNPTLYTIGQSYGGGVVFHTFRESNVERCLVVSVVDITSNIAWSNITTQNASTNQWDGQSNTLLMGIGANAGAWKACKDYTGGGSLGWYLPSMDEMRLVVQNQFNINKTLSTISGSSAMFLNAFYWTSSEVANDTAWYYYLIDDKFYEGQKSAAYTVRAIKKF